MEKVRVLNIVWKDVAVEAGISAATVYNWKKTNRRTHRTTDEKICKALFALYGVSVHDIQDQLG